MTTKMNEYQPILDLYQEVSKAQGADALMAALAMIYVGIDTMAWLSLPIGCDEVNRTHFYDWVNTYFKADAAQPYQYVGIDVYAARCALLHKYGSIAKLHQQPNPPKTFGYLDNGSHRADDGQLVMISIAVLIRDFGRAITAYLQAIQLDANLKVRIDSRIDALMSSTWTVHKSS